MADKKTCPYCKEQTLVINGDECSCENEQCNFDSRRIDDLEAIEQGGFLEEKEDIAELMETYDGGLR